MRKRLFLPVLVLLLVLAAIVVVACKEETTASSGEVTTTAPAEPTETLKIGIATGLGWPVGLDIKRGCEVLAEATNAAGGLEIGDKMYEIELICEDTNSTQDGETAAINKLVFEDEVDYIFSDANFIMGWQSVTEENQVVVLCVTPLPPILMPPNKYTFQAAFINTSADGPLGWFTETYPDLTDWIIAYADNEMGHVVAEATKPSFEAYGLNVTNEFYPVGQQDLSALGTKVVTANPDVFDAAGSGPAQDGLAHAAVYQAGYRGQYYVNDLTDAMAQVTSVESLEGAVGRGLATEFDPCLTEKGQAFIDLWTAKYGQWDSPALEGTYFYDLLTAALQAAGTTDPTVVADLIAGGFEYETTEGPSVMIARTDLGNDRTCDSLCTAYIKQIVDGKATLVATISPEKVLEYFQATHTGPPPAMPGP